MGNNPINYNDVLGLDEKTINGKKHNRTKLSGADLKAANKETGGKYKDKIDVGGGKTGQVHNIKGSKDGSMYARDEEGNVYKLTPIAPAEQKEEHIGVYADKAKAKMGGVISEDKVGIQNDKKVNFSNKQLWKGEANKFDFKRAANDDTWGKRTDQFIQGTGSTNMYFASEHPMNKAIRDMDHIDKARQFFYDKYKKEIANGILSRKDFVEDYSGVFPVYDVFKYGFNGNKQFIGSVTINVYTSDDAKTLIFVVANTTSNTSLMYHLPVKNTSRKKGEGGPPKSTINNLYIWSEPIRSQ